MSDDRPPPIRYDLTDVFVLPDEAVLPPRGTSVIRNHGESWFGPATQGDRSWTMYVRTFWTCPECGATWAIDHDVAWTYPKLIKCPIDECPGETVIERFPIVGTSSR